jgi:hypothetical protein
LEKRGESINQVLSKGYGGIAQVCKFIGTVIDSPRITAVKRPSPKVEYTAMASLALLV